MAEEACCTCATILAPPSYNFADEKKEQRTPDPPRRLPCCQRAICAACVSKNPRFASYCPFCQVSTKPSSLPQGLRDPPAYSPPASPKRRAAVPESDTTSSEQSEEPPSYSSLSSTDRRAVDQQSQDQPDVLHHLHPTDTITSLSLAYHVPAPILRSHNSLFQDSMLPARRTLLIPASHYTGPSLSDQPVESAEETERKAKIRRFMVGAKCPAYEVAELYLGNAGGDVEKAVARWWEDEKWEKENPYKGKGKGKEGRGVEMRGFGGGLTGQLR